MTQPEDPREILGYDPEPAKWSRRAKCLMVVAAAGGLAVAVLLGAHNSQGKRPAPPPQVIEPGPVPQPTAPLPVPVPIRRVLPPLECTKDPKRVDPPPFRHLQGYVQAVVDGRCQRRQTVTFYDQPAYGAASAQAKNGEVVIAGCHTTGQPVPGPRSSDEWVHTIVDNESTGWEPEQVWVPLGDLTGLSLQDISACSRHDMVK